MGNDDHSYEREIRDRIAKFVQKEEQATRKQVSPEEVAALNAAVGRLDKLIALAAEGEHARKKALAAQELQALNAASRKLDQLLTFIADKDPETESNGRRRANKPADNRRENP